MKEKEDLVLMGYANLETVTPSVFPSSVHPSIRRSFHLLIKCLAGPPVKLHLWSVYVEELVSVYTFVTLSFMYFLSPPGS